MSLLLLSLLLLLQHIVVVIVVVIAAAVAVVVCVVVYDVVDDFVVGAVVSSLRTIGRWSGAGNSPRVFPVTSHVGSDLFGNFRQHLLS